MLSVVVDDQARAEVEAYIEAHAELVDEHGHRLVVRNGHAPARTITTGSARSKSSDRGWTTDGSILHLADGCSSRA